MSEAKRHVAEIEQYRKSLERFKNNPKSDPSDALYAIFMMRNMQKSLEYARAMNIPRRSLGSWI